MLGYLGPNQGKFEPLGQRQCDKASPARGEE